MLYEITIIVVLNLLFYLGSKHAAFYKLYCRHTIQYLTDLYTIPSVPHNILEDEEVEYIHLYKAVVTLFACRVVFILNVGFLFIIHLSYTSTTPVNETFLIIMASVNAVTLYYVVSSIYDLSYLVQTLLTLHAYVLTIYEQKQSTESKDSEEQVHLGFIIEKYKEWLGGVEALDNLGDAPHGKNE